MNRPFSKLSVAHDTSENQNHVQERARLVGLVKTWRLKHDKLFASAQQHQGEVQKLQSDIARLEEEKDTITKHLTTQLQSQQSANETAMQELRKEAEIAREKPEVKSRYLELKLKKLESETEPIIKFYKRRDIEMIEKVESLKKEVESLQENKNALQMEILRFRNQTKFSQLNFNKSKLHGTKEGNKYIRSSLPCLRKLEKTTVEETDVKLITSPQQTQDLQKPLLKNKISENIKDLQSDDDSTADISEADTINVPDYYKPSDIVSLFTDFWLLQW